MNTVYIVVGVTPSNYDDSGDTWIEAVFESRYTAELHKESMEQLNSRVQIARDFKLRAINEWIDKNPPPRYKGNYEVETVAQHQLLAKAWNIKCEEEKEAVWARCLGERDISALENTKGGCPEDASYEIQEFEVWS